MWVMPAVRHVMCLLSGDHALCGSYQQYVMQCVCCLEIMLHAGHASSMSCNVFAV